MEETRKFFDPLVLSRLTNMELIARLVVEGFISGLHKSPYHGFSVEFAEHRQYMPGDEIRSIDWKVYGKSDKFYVKEYEEETNLKSYLILDMSSSMGYSSGAVSKLEYGSYLVASLAHLMLRQRDAVGLITFDEDITHFIPPRGNTIHIHNILKRLGSLTPGGETDTRKVFHALAERIKRRGLIIIISDFLDDPETILLGLKHFRHRKHEVIAFHLLDPADFPVEIFFKDYLTNHTFDHSLFHIRIKASLPFDFHYGSKENGESGGERTIAENSLEVQRDAGSWLKALDQILQIYHEVGTEEKERFLQVVGNIRANSQEEFFLRPENVTCALGAMEMVYRVGCPRAGGVEDGKTDDDKTDQSGSGCPDTSEHYLSGADSGGRGSRGRGSRSRREQRG